MSDYDRWISTDFAADQAEAAHAAFDQSDDYLNAYVDYCEVFDQSAHYDKAYERWVSGLDEDDEFDDPDFRTEFTYDLGITPDENDEWINR